MSPRKPSIAIGGAGLGGLTAAATLRLAGFDVREYGYGAWNTPLNAPAPAPA